MKRLISILIFVFTFSSLGAQTFYRENLEKAEKENDSMAMALVGIAYLQGEEVEANPVKAVSWFQKSAGLGNAFGQYNLAECLCSGIGISRNFELGAMWALKSAKQGYDRAQYLIGKLYSNGDGVKQDAEEAFKWFMRAAEQNMPEAQLRVSTCYHYGNGIAPNYTEAFNWCKKAAEQGYVGAELNMAYYYMDGLGVDVNIGKAFEWALKAAKQNMAEAQFLVSWCYYNGKGTNQNYVEAFSWCKKAAEQGYTDAELSMAHYYKNGLGVDANVSKAFEWYLKAAQSGNADAQYSVGLLYSKGDGIKQDYAQAVKWYSAAMEQNHAWAYNNMAYLYMNGTGVPKNTQKAFEMVDKAIELEPDKINFYDTKGELYTIMGDKDNALKIWQQIIAKEPNFKNEDTPFVQYMQKIQDSDVDMEIPTTTIKNESTFVVVISNEAYRREAQVPYAVNDGKSFAAYCKQTLGIPDVNIHYIENATLNDMKYHLNWLKQVVDVYGASSKAIVYYAGHGIPDEKTKAAYLLPIDGYGMDVSTGYKLDELYNTLSSLSAQSVTVFLDACFSGTKREGDMMTVARGVAIKTKPATPVGKLVVFSAAQGDETAYPYNEQQHGMFTYFLLKKLQETKGNVTLGDLSDYVIEQVRKKSVLGGKMQTPTIMSSETLNDQWKGWQLR